MTNNTVLISIVIGFVAWFYFNKFQESEKEYFKLHKKYVSAQSENCKMKNRLKDLQIYKNDVSKTFKILDNELLMINDHIKKTNVSTYQIQDQDQDQMNIHVDHNHTTTPIEMEITRPSSNRISILTPEILNALFNNINQETDTTVEMDQTYTETQVQDVSENLMQPQDTNVILESVNASEELEKPGIVQLLGGLPSSDGYEGFLIN